MQAHNNSTSKMIDLLFAKDCLNHLYETPENNNECVNNITSVITYISNKYDIPDNSLDNKYMYQISY